MIGLAPGVVLLLILLALCGVVGVVSVLRRDRREEADALAEGRIRELEDRLHQLEDVVLAMGAEVRQLGGEVLTPLPPPRSTSADARPTGSQPPESAARERARSTS